MQYRSRQNDEYENTWYLNKMITVRLASALVTRVGRPDVLCEKTPWPSWLYSQNPETLIKSWEKMAEKSQFSFNKILDPWDYGVGVRGKKWKEGEREIKEHIPKRI